MVFVDETWFETYILNDLCQCGDMQHEQRCTAQVQQKLQKMLTDQCAKGSISKQYFNLLIEAMFNIESASEIHMLLSLNDDLAATIERNNDVNTRVRLLVDGALRAFLFWKEKTGPNDAELLLVCAKPQPPPPSGAEPPRFGRSLIREFIQRMLGLDYYTIFLSRVENEKIKDNKNENKLKKYYEQFGFKSVWGENSTPEMRLDLLLPAPSNKRPRDEEFEEDKEYEEKLPRLAPASSETGAGAGAVSSWMLRAKPQVSSPEPPALPPNKKEEEEEEEEEEVKFMHTIHAPAPRAAPNIEAELDAAHLVEDFARENYLTLEEAAEELGLLRGGGGRSRGGNKNTYFLGASWRRGKKYVVVAHNSRTKTNGPPIHFGDVNTPNFTQHHNTKLRDEYLQRQQRRGAGGPATPQFWDRWILWNKPTKRESIRALERALHAEIRPF